MVSKRKRRRLDLENNLCCSPLRKRRCGKANIEVYLRYGNEILPICSSCWKKLADHDWNEEDSKEVFVYVPCIEGMKTKEFKRRK